jgi:Tol biopolymer transport system component
MRRESVGRWSWFLTAVVISVLGLAGCGGGGGGGGGGGVVPVSPFTRVGGNNNSGDLGAALSQTGRFVAFSSLASDLVGTDNNSTNDIFLYDRQTADITVVSRRLPEDASNTKSARANGGSYFPSIAVNPAGSAIIAFESDATNLISPADPADVNTDIFVHNKDLNTTEQVSVALGGGPRNGDSNKPSVSADGNIVVFHSLATNLVAADINGVADVFLRNRSAGTTTMVSGAAGGAVWGQCVSDNGSRVAFESPPGGAAKQIFVWTSPGPAVAITSGAGDSRISGISGNGQFVVFDSDAALVAGDNNGVSDVYIYNITSGTLERVSVTSTGAQATGGGSFALGHRAISNDGNLVVFESDATNLGGTGSTNFYVRDRAAGTTTPLAAVSGTNVSAGVTISADGLVAALATDEALVSGDTLGLFDVFIMAVP